MSDTRRPLCIGGMDAVSRIVAVSVQVNRQMFREKLLLGFSTVFALFAGSTWWLKSWHFGSAAGVFMADVGFAVMSVVGSLFAVFVTVHTFYCEVEQRTAHVLLARALSRSEFMVGKWIGVVVLLGLFFILATTTLGALLVCDRLCEEGFSGGLEGGFGPFGLGQVGLVAGFQWVKSGVLAAYVLGVAALVRTRTLALVMGFLVWTACQLQSVVVESVAISDQSSVHSLLTWVSFALPDFQMFDLSDWVIAGSEMTGELALRILLYGGGYGTLALAIAVGGLHGREL